MKWQDWLLYPIQHVSTGATSADLWACSCACFPLLLGGPSLCALSASGLPARPVELWECLSSLGQTCPKAPSHCAARRTGTAGSVLLLHNLAGRRSFFFKLCFWTCAFWHDIINIVQYRMEKVKIIRQVQQERQGLFSWESKYFKS